MAGELAPEVEQQLADMSDEDWNALRVRVRLPAPGEAGAREARRRFANRGGAR